MTIALFGRVRSNLIECRKTPSVDKWLNERNSYWNRWFDHLEDLLAVELSESANAGENCRS